MKKIVISLGVVFLLCIGVSVCLHLSNPISPSTVSPSLSPTSTSVTTPTTSQLSLCTPQDLSGAVTFEGAAGSIYGTFIITNKSTNTCTIIGQSSVSLQYDADIKNIAVHQKSPVKEVRVELLPHTSISAMAQFPNGPQCSSDIKKLPVTFSYQLENNTTVAFSNDSFQLTGCSDEAEITTIEVSPFIK